MSVTNHADEYLVISEAYGAALNGLWWSSNRDAIERRDGSTLAVIDEVRAVLEGALAKPPVPHFAFVLNLLHLMKTGEIGFESLHEAFTRTRGTANRGRNVGLLIAELCRELPNDGDAVAPADVSLALRTLRLSGEGVRPDAVREPPLTRSEFECRVAHRLTAFSGAELVHWLTYGGPTVGSGERLADEAETLPQRVARLLALARRRARLVGAASLVPALDAALTLPPRGRPPEALPLGGYCDVTTRGAPDRLLPGQFALDPDEFVRRFAENELLYFKREEPHDAVRPERVVVLDQGVRTWGSVRLALTAAAVSLLRVDPKRCGPPRLFLTSALEPVDPATEEPAALANLLEASDLTPNPNETLVRALHDPNSEADVRDVILLTHPRTAHEPATYAGGTRGESDRVFVLTVDESGRAELGEWVNGGLVSLRSFRVDLKAAEAARPESDAPPAPKPIVPAPEDVPWTGDVEPVPFAFRPGLLAEPQTFGFDADGEWLVIAGRDGALHGMGLDGRPPEVLPRPFRDGRLLKQVDAVLGAKGGAVVCGRMAVSDGPAAAPEPQNPAVAPHNVPVLASGATEPAPAERFVAVHYDRVARRVTLHVLGEVDEEGRWTAHPDLHCVTVLSDKGAGCALDLGTHGRYPDGRSDSALVSRARLAWSRAPQGAPPYEVPVVSALPTDETNWRTPFLYQLSREAMYLRQAPTTWRPLVPHRDGRPLLDGAEIHRAQLAGDVLALSYLNAGERRLLLLRGPHGAVLADVQHPVRGTFALSPDGSALARRDVNRTVAVSRTADPARVVASAAPAALHDTLAIDLLGSFRLVVTIGGYQHGFEVEGDTLVYRSKWEVVERPARTWDMVPHPPTAHDDARFPIRERAEYWIWQAVLDRFGQVLVYRRHEAHPVAAFLIRRERAAAWVPGGVFWGDPRLIGGPATPDAAQKIGRALMRGVKAVEGR